MSNVENLEDHMAFSCKCGCVRFNLLKSGGIECDDCGEKIDSTWGMAQPEQEPVAYLCENAVGHKYFRWKKPSSTYKPIALYTTPPQRTWVGLTEQEAAECWSTSTVRTWQAIEAKLKEKNT